jgi:hypothetical protein
MNCIFVYQLGKIRVLEGSEVEDLPFILCREFDYFAMC